MYCNTNVSKTKDNFSNRIHTSCWNEYSRRVSEHLCVFCCKEITKENEIGYTSPSSVYKIYGLSVPVNNFKWIKGHAGNNPNNECGRIAREMSQKAIDEKCDFMISDLPKIYKNFKNLKLKKIINILVLVSLNPWCFWILTFLVY